MLSEQDIIIAKQACPFKFKLGKFANDILINKKPFYATWKGHKGESEEYYITYDSTDNTWGYSYDWNGATRRHSYDDLETIIGSEWEVNNKQDYIPSINDVILPEITGKLDMEIEITRSPELFDLVDRLLDSNCIKARRLPDNTFQLHSTNIRAGVLFDRTFKRKDDALLYGAIRLQYAQLCFYKKLLNRIIASKLSYTPEIDIKSISPSHKITWVTHSLEHSSFGSGKVEKECSTEYEVVKVNKETLDVLYHGYRDSVEKRRLSLKKLYSTSFYHTINDNTFVFSGNRNLFDDRVKRLNDNKIKTIEKIDKLKNSDYWK